MTARSAAEMPDRHHAEPSLSIPELLTTAYRQNQDWRRRAVGSGRGGEAGQGWRWGLGVEEQGKEKDLC